MMTNLAKARFAGVAVLSLLTSFATGARAERTRGRTGNVLAAGYSHVILIPNGTATSALAWGTNASSELGTGSASPSKSAAPLNPKLAHISQIAAGKNFSLAIAGGALYGWGLNNQNQTGATPGTTPVLKPTQVGTATNWKSVTAGTTHGLGLTASGGLYAWGQNSDGELGQGNTTTTKSLVPVTGAYPWIAATAGNQFSIGIQADGTAYAWGHNASGQLGVGNTTAQHSPTKIASTLPWVAIAAGDSHAIGIKADGTLWGWGLNDKGQTGCETNCSNTSSPVQIGPSAQWAWRAVAVGGKSSYAIRSDGVLWSWGDNTEGQLGISDSYGHEISFQTVGFGYQYVVAGNDFVVAIGADGNVRTWGNDASGQLAASPTGGKTTLPARVPETGAVPQFTAVKPPMVDGGGGGLDASTGGGRIKTSGVLETWGSGLNTALTAAQLSTAQSAGLCDATLACYDPIPALLPSWFGQGPFTQVSVGAQGFALASDNSLWTWVSPDNSTPGTLNRVGTGTPWLQITASRDNGDNYGIQPDGSLWSVGAGTTPALTAMCPSGSACFGQHWASVQGSGFVNLGVTTDGQLWGWGTGQDSGLMGDSSTTVSSPVNLAAYGAPKNGYPTSTWLDAQVDGQDSSALDSLGNIWGWGYDGYGQIGFGQVVTGAGEAIPQKVASNIVSVCRANESAVALDNKGALYGWGGNAGGELGVADGPAWVTNLFTGYQPGTNSTDAEAEAWQAAGVPSPIAAIWCGSSSVYAEDANGSIWATGANTNGGLGIGTGSGAYSPHFQGAAYSQAVGAFRYTASTNPNATSQIGSGYWTTSRAQANGDWIQHNLGTFTYVSSIWLQSGTATTYPVSYAVDYFDGSNWIRVATGTGAPNMAITFPVVLAQYIRVTDTGSSSNPWTVATFNSME